MQVTRYRNSAGSGDAVPVFVDGLRSPFVKSFGDFAELDCLALFSRVLSAFIRKVAVSPQEYDEILAGVVVPQPKNPNVARDAIINLNLPANIHGSTTNKACASSLHTIAQAVATIKSGQPLLILAGGVEILSDVPIVYSQRASKFLVKVSKAKRNIERLKLLKNHGAKRLDTSPSLSF